MISRVIYITWFWVVLGSAQNKQLLYDFTQIPQSLMQNPGANVNNEWHAGLPLLSGVYISAGSSGFSVYDVFADDGVDINDKIRDVIYTAGSNDIMSVHEEVEILFGGFKGRSGWHEKNYYSFGWYQEFDHFNYWPRDLAILAYDGNRDYLGQRFNLRHATVKTELVSVLHFGVLRKVSESLSVGGRLKVYSGIADITSTHNNGRFFTDFGTNNEYVHTVIADLELNTSGYGIIDELEDGNDIASGLYGRFKRRALLGGNLGMGVDLGFSYKFKKKWKLTASVLDFGFIHHSKDVKNYAYRGRYDFEGLDLVFPGIIDDDGDVYDYWQDLADELEELYDTTSTRYTTLRPLRLNAGLSYAFGRKGGKDCDCRAYEKDYDNTLGVHFSAIHRPRYPQLALTAYYQKRIADFLQARAAYTVDKFSATNIGIGLSTHFGNFNLYILADNLLEYENLADAHNASVQFGINYIVPERN
ncbi:DUF5723 family protein [Zhouia spongiae]|uniref:DUF5723 family protein n=1 Tax=Zhouia spongiae TaxID=2202721 RepID=A0ABY3YRT5_9FLAO|nr:DUF5723 family protein [Zhouia spongiae]UNZ00394.1 DUF5723 family protein [Zhouia spongiae]